jgi:RNA polymerase sigma factor (sigma-70 family)
VSQVITAPDSASPAEQSRPEIVNFEYELTCGFAARYIRRKARALARHSKVLDTDDLAQELTLKLWENLRSFDRQQGCFNAFVKLVVHRDALHLKRKLLQEGDHRKGEGSLSELVPGSDGKVESLGSLIGQRELDAKLGRESLEWNEAVELKHAVAEAIEQLPPRLADVARRLMTHTPSQVSRDTQLARRTVYQLIARIRKHLVEMGFGEDFGIICDNSRSPRELNQVEAPIITRNIA